MSVQQPMTESPATEAGDADSAIGQVRVLLVERDDRIAKPLTAALAGYGFATRRARTGSKAIELGPSGDAVLLGLALPDLQGVEVCARLRRACEVPIIAMAAHSDVRARVNVLESGADDCVSMPCDVHELIARINSIRRRSAAARTPGHGRAGSLRVGDLVIDSRTRTAACAGRPLALTPKEFDVLALLADDPGVVHRREKILSTVWGPAWVQAGHCLDVHIATLRAKLGQRELITTIRRVGYRLAGEVTG